MYITNIPKLEEVAERVWNHVKGTQLDSDTFINICCTVESLSCNYDLLEHHETDPEISEDDRWDVMNRRKNRILEIIANLYHLILS